MSASSSSPSVCVAGDSQELMIRVLFADGREDRLSLSASSTVADVRMSLCLTLGIDPPEAISLFRAGSARRLGGQESVCCGSGDGTTRGEHDVLFLAKVNCLRADPCPSLLVLDPQANMTHCVQNVAPHTRVEEVLLEVAELRGSPFCEKCILEGVAPKWGRQLRDKSKTLEEYQLPSPCTLTLIDSNTTRNLQSLTVRTMMGHQSLLLRDIKDCTTIASLKEVACRGLNRDPQGARLVLPSRDEHLSQEGWTVAEYMLSAGDTLYLLPNPRAAKTTQ